MRSTLSLLVLAAIIATASAASPAFCNGLDCPMYSEIQQGNLTIRTYEPAAWAVTYVNDTTSWSAATEEAFGKLFKYISGANVNNAKVEMTAPVRTIINPSQGPFCASSFQVGFFVPFSFQPNPPTPSDPTVTILRDTAFKVAVKSYSGYATDSTVQQYATSLLADLQAAGVTTNPSQIYTAGYDSPFHIFNRHNEVWLIVQ